MGGSGPRVEESALANGTLDTVLLLKSVPVFSQVHVEDLEVVAAFVGEADFDMGQAVIKEGEQQAGMLVVKSGRLTKCHSSKGQWEPVATFERGQTIDELSLFDDAPSDSTVIAGSQCQVVSITREALEKAIALRPQIGEAVRRNGVSERSSASP